MNLTHHGKCTECGECCGHILPISKQEIINIKRYVKVHNIAPMPKNIFKIGMTMPLKNMNCPFFDYTKSTHKCKIYPVRPDICKAYKCDKDGPKLLDDLNDLGANCESLEPRNMWEAFGFVTKENPAAACALYNVLEAQKLKK